MKEFYAPPLAQYREMCAQKVVEGVLPRMKRWRSLSPLPGGSAHQETWDPKYLAPQEYRGPLGSVETKIRGERFSQYLPKSAAIADKLTVIRSLTHSEAAHERGTHNMMTGVRPSPATVFPSFGSIVSHEFGSRKNLPPYVAIPSQSGYGGTGYLGSAYGAFSLGADPGSSSFRVPHSDAWVETSV